MNDDAIRREFKLWKTRLILDHWSVKLVIVDSKKMHPDNAAEVSSLYKYFKAVITITRDYQGKMHNRRGIQKLIIHELLHLHLAGCNLVINTPEQMVEEQAIEVITRAMLGLHDGEIDGD